VRILFGVQATGQGHVSRCRALARELSSTSARVTWLVSGRERCALYGMEEFGDFLHRRGLSFVSRNGNLSVLGTLRRARLLRFIRDVYSLELDDYDLIVSDFEPVTAWAGRLANRRVIGIGHQYAFGPATPLTGDTWLSRMILRQFAPVTTAVGLHWHPYDVNVLPPILDLPPLDRRRGDQVLVYLPFENQHTVMRWLQRFPQQRFIQYSAELSDSEAGNVSLRSANAHSFKVDLAACRGAICNSGFELISECLFLGKPVLTKPLLGQLEQQSNALSLARLGFAQIITALDHDSLARWLQEPPVLEPQAYPRVAALLADWLAGGCVEAPQQLSSELWSQMGFPRHKRIAGASRCPDMPMPRPAP
jgi:uncharacterized protein (TIGR00661 family)